VSVIKMGEVSVVGSSTKKNLNTGDLVDTLAVARRRSPPRSSAADPDFSELAAPRARTVLDHPDATDVTPSK
jgi:hypothetical protein